MHPHLHYLRCHLLFEACSRFRISLKGTSNILASTHATKSNLRKISKTILPSDYTICFWTFPAWYNELRSGCSLHPPTQLHQFTRIIWYDSFLICATPCSLCPLLPLLLLYVFVTHLSIFMPLPLRNTFMSWNHISYLTHTGNFANRKRYHR